MSTISPPEPTWVVDDEAVAALATPARPGLLRRGGRSIARMIARSARAVGSGLGWLFGLASLWVGLSILAALPIVQFLTLGYFLDSAARVARSGRLRDGFVGVRRAGRFGSFGLGIVATMLPVWLTRSYTSSAVLIDPSGNTAAAWRVLLALVSALAFGHLMISAARGGRLRHFAWPIGNILWLVRSLRTRGIGAIYSESRDAFWNSIVSLRLPYYFRVGAVGYLGTFAWLAPPAALLAASGQYPLLGVVGAIWLAVVVPFLPFLQVRYAVEGRWRVFTERRAVRERFLRAPWAFAFSLAVLLIAAIPLYLLKIEMIPREAAWLPSLVFVAFLAPARILIGWADARSARREQPRHWFFRWVGRLAIVPVALGYVLFVYISQFTSWGGGWSLFEQHAFLLPVPFMNM